MTSDETYFPGNRENLQEPIQMQLSKELFSENSPDYMKSAFNFKHFEKNDKSHSLCLSDIIDCEIGAYINV